MFNNAVLEKAMQEFKNGNTYAFETIYEQTNRMVYYIIYSILKDRGRSEDVMQTVYMRIDDKISMYDSSDSSTPKAWIASIARNLAINEYHRAKKEAVIDIDVADCLQDDKETGTPLIDLASKNLPDDEFTILMLCVVEGYKRREVAQIMNLSTSGVTWKLDQALNKLRKLTEGDKR